MADYASREASMITASSKERRLHRAAPPAAGCALALTALACGAAAPGPADGVIDAERRFAASVASDGIGPGFLAFLADSAVVFTPDPRPARPIYENLKDDGARLIWRPDLASVSSAGDFAWTSGPWLHFSKDATTADLYGHFFTVWRHALDGGWKVLLDGGVTYPVPVERRDALPAVVAHVRRSHRAGAAAEPPCEQRYFADWQRKGRGHALDAYAARDVRLLANASPPLDGRAALDGDALKDAPLIAARVARRLSSDGGDLYVAYGEYEIGVRGQFGKRRYAFATAFDASDDCRLALELITPLASSAATQP